VIAFCHKEVKMKYLFFSILALSLTASIAFAEKVLTNEDLEKFKVAPISKTPTENSSANTGEIEVQQNKEDAQLWCNRARELKDRISSAKAAHSQAQGEKAEAELNFLRMGSSAARKEASSKLSQAEAAVQAAESALRDLEDDAHRQGIPPGWLRCQFE